MKTKYLYFAYDNIKNNILSLLIFSRQTIKILFVSYIGIKQDFETKSQYPVRSL